MSKVNKTVVMRVTPDEAAKLRYQRKFDKAWANEQAQLADGLATSIAAARQAFGASMSRPPNVVYFPLGMSPDKCAKAVAPMPELLGFRAYGIILDELGEVAQ